MTGRITADFATCGLATRSSCQRCYCSGSALVEGRRQISSNWSWQSQRTVVACNAALQHAHLSSQQRLTVDTPFSSRLRSSVGYSPGVRPSHWPPYWRSCFCRRRSTIRRQRARKTFKRRSHWRHFTVGLKPNYMINYFRNCFIADFAAMRFSAFTTVKIISLHYPLWKYWQFFTVQTR